MHIEIDYCVTPICGYVTGADGLQAMTCPLCGNTCFRAVVDVPDSEPTEATA